MRGSGRHAVLLLEDGRWVLADNGSTNGTYAGNRRVDRIEITGECLVRRGHPVDELPGGAAPPGGGEGESEGEGDGTLEIPYAVRWLVPKASGSRTSTS